MEEGDYVAKRNKIVRVKNDIAEIENTHTKDRFLVDRDMLGELDRLDISFMMKKSGKRGYFIGGSDGCGGVVRLGQVVAGICKGSWTHIRYANGDICDNRRANIIVLTKGNR